MVADPNGLFLCGDSCQTIARGIGFRCGSKWACCCGQMVTTDSRLISLVPALPPAPSAPSPLQVYRCEAVIFSSAARGGGSARRRRRGGAGADAPDRAAGSQLPHPQVVAGTDALQNTQHCSLWIAGPSLLPIPCCLADLARLALTPRRSGVLDVAAAVVQLLRRYFAEHIDELKPELAFLEVG